MSPVEFFTHPESHCSFTDLGFWNMCVYKAVPSKSIMQRIKEREKKKEEAREENGVQILN